MTHTAAGSVPTAGAGDRPAPAGPPARSVPGSRPPVRVLLVTGGTHGDLHPFLALAQRFSERGHAATVLGPAALGEAARRSGVDWCGLGDIAEYHAVLEDPALWHPRKGFRVLWRGVERSWSALEQALQATVGGDGPCLVLAHPLALPVVAAAAERDARLRPVAVWLAPSNLRTVHDLPRFGPLPVPRATPAGLRHWAWRQVDAHLLDPVALPGLNAHRAAAGLAPVTGFVDHVQTAAPLSLALFPAWFAATQPDWPQPLLQVGFPLYDPPADRPWPDAVESLLTHGPAPIVVTAGTGRRFAAPVFAAASEAAQRLGRPLVALTAYRDQLPPVLPPGMAWAPSARLDRLLPRAATLVHHGGIGTTAQALRAGVAQLVVPSAYDQFDNAARVERLGVGLAWWPWRRLEAGPMARTLGRLLTGGCPARAAERAKSTDWPEQDAWDRALDRVVASADDPSPTGGRR
jgi:rhamnosyltransferase subunit B